MLELLVASGATLWYLIFAPTDAYVTPNYNAILTQHSYLYTVHVPKPLIQLK